MNNACALSSLGVVAGVNITEMLANVFFPPVFSNIGWSMPASQSDVFLALFCPGSPSFPCVFPMSAVTVRLTVIERDSKVNPIPRKSEMGFK